MDLNQLKAAMEAVIFVAEDPVPMVRMKEIFPEESYDKLETAISQLMEEFSAGRPGLEIREIAGGFCMRTRPEHHEWVRAYLKTRPGARLSLPALETLAVVAYRQPITVAEILSIRGLKSSSALKTLLEKKLIDACGRKKVIGRPILYGTTKQFLMHFGLKDLKELPSIEEFEEFLKQDHLPQETRPEEIEPLDQTSKEQEESPGKPERTEPVGADESKEGKSGMGEEPADFAKVPDREIDPAGKNCGDSHSTEDSEEDVP